MIRRLREVVPASARAALAIWLVFAVLHACGARELVSVLSGTPVPGVPFEVAGLFGMIYVVAWLGSVVVAPVLALAAALGTLAGAHGGSITDAAPRGGAR